PSTIISVSEPFPTPVVRWRMVEAGSVSGREEAPGKRVPDEDRLFDQELPRARLPSVARPHHRMGCVTNEGPGPVRQVETAARSVAHPVRAGGPKRATSTDRPVTNVIAPRYQ